VVVKDAQALEQVYSEIEKIPDLALAKNTIGRGLFNLEIAASLANKGEAVSRLAKMLGIDESEVAVIGDSGNDYPMISRFEKSFAVKNARSTIKEAANYELCSNNEHAIEYLLKNVIGED
jgi:hydroxymethylpyrimidine pyrophosphatase-like HAD family hydrolase